MLKITKISATIGDITVLEDIELEVNEGEIHAIIGPTGAGKSILANLILGHPELILSKGRINFKRKALAKLSPAERSRLGIYVTYSDPPEISGMTNLEMVQGALASSEEKKELTTVINSHKELAKCFELGAEWSGKDFNVNSTLLERRKNELVQMYMLDPALAIIDDIDSDLDDATVSELGNSINTYLSKKGKAGIIITQSATILETIKPTHVHVLVGGKIVKSGDRRIIKGIIKDGYRKFS